MILDTRMPPGSDWYIPIDIGALNGCSSYSDFKQWINPTFQDHYGGPGDDVYYKFSLSTGANVTMAACSDDIHGFWVHLLNESFELIQEGVPGEDGCYLSTYLEAGNYNLIVEGEPDSYPFAYNLPVAVWTSNCGRISTGSTDEPNNEYKEEVKPSINNVEELKELVRLFPIPAENILTVDPKFVTPYNVSITDIIGNPVKEWKGLQYSIDLDIKDIANGIYLVTINERHYRTIRKIEIRK
jgi:Secretion system C-terminal sorting domain